MREGSGKRKQIGGRTRTEPMISSKYSSKPVSLGVLALGGIIAIASTSPYTHAHTQLQLSAAPRRLPQHKPLRCIAHDTNLKDEEAIVDQINAVTAQLLLHCTHQQTTQATQYICSHTATFPLPLLPCALPCAGLRWHQPAVNVAVLPRSPARAVLSFASV
jgi:hypothetical protein